MTRATLEVDDGEGEIEFDSRPSENKPLLDFDPRAQTIDVFSGGVVFATGTMTAEITGVSACEESEISSSLTSTGLDPDGTASVRGRNAAVGFPCLWSSSPSSSPPRAITRGWPSRNIATNSRVCTVA